METKVCAELLPSKGREILFHASLLTSGGLLVIFGFLNLQKHQPNLCLHLYMVFSLWACLQIWACVQISPLCKDTSHTLLGAHSSLI